MYLLIIVHYDAHALYDYLRFTQELSRQMIFFTDDNCSKVSLINTEYVGGSLI